jgi:hypothetical protein
MSDGDLSTLAAAAKTPKDASVGTGAGSMNDVLWSEFCALGWMAQESLPPSLESKRRYSITTAGIEPIQKLLSAAQQRKQTLHEKRLDIYKRLCVPFAIKLHEELLKVDSSYGTTVTLAGMTLAVILKSCIAPADHEKVAAQILELAKRQAAA